ncbi:PIN domain-containing protein [Pedobacter aquae]|uniref:PIN domain-containing protein n=1 Tax=Pedobacter aquae TaxID=2605747 RepID=A0A5C0VHR8_9SPHI|nr:PIN domain-containing protein [Pedobacter aquae]QEK51211.1 PIN domain-containing protein [Pedobacter aquae]
MNIFLDANILVSVLNKEYPLFTYSSRILSLANQPKYNLYTSPVCLAIAFYFTEKKSKSALAKQKIETLCEHILIADNTSAAVKNTLLNKKAHDFEDGLEYYAAIEKKCSCIITENKEDFYFAEIEVLSSKEFFNQYMLKN